jgi:prephenate dehydrogenase
MFADSAEADGMMASVHLLPQLVAAALLNSTLEQSGWLETRQIASKPYALVTSAIAETDSLRDAALSNKENTLRVLDSLIISLTDLRQAISSDDVDWLGKRLKSAREGRLQWWEGRVHGEWRDPNFKTLDGPTFVAQMKQTFFGERRKPPK